MTEFYQLRYGMKVRVTEGENTGKEGWVCMASRFGDLGINTREATLGYDFRIGPSQIEIVSREIHPNFKDISDIITEDALKYARNALCLENPDLVLANPEYFEEEEIKKARDTRVNNMLNL